MAANGRLPGSVLAPIAGGRLRRDAAHAFNAMNAESIRRFGVTLRPTGPVSSYRPISAQVYFWNLYRSGRGNLAAYPGTSNHGWGLAVDFATPQMRAIVDRIGARYGWQKRWSDAPGEWWHIRWREGHYAAAQSGPPTLRRGVRAKSVTTLKRLLHRKGYRQFSRKGSSNVKDRFFGAHCQAAVKRFQRRHHLHADGIVGPATWAALRR
jgi:hypothetical protein